jgi:hypothetical protein
MRDDLGLEGSMPSRTGQDAPAHQSLLAHGSIFAARTCRKPGPLKAVGADDWFATRAIIRVATRFDLRTRLSPQRTPGIPLRAVIGCLGGSPCGEPRRSAGRA